MPGGGLGEKCRALRVWGVLGAVLEATWARLGRILEANMVPNWLPKANENEDALTEADSSDQEADNLLTESKNAWR